MGKASRSEIGLRANGLARNGFQVCGVRSDGVVVCNRAVSRGRPVQLLSDRSACDVVKGSCATLHPRGRAGSWLYARPGDQFERFNPLYSATAIQCTITELTAPASTCLMPVHLRRIDEHMQNIY